MRSPFRIVLLAVAVALTAPSVLIADGGKPTATVDELSGVRELIQSKHWSAAISQLKQINDTSSADWNNLMGFTYRKSDPPDLVTAEKYYRTALAINPKHLGTLEYLGEMRLQQGDLAGAEQQLAALKSATFFKSSEYKDLSKAIDRYRSTGKYVAED